MKDFSQIFIILKLKKKTTENTLFPTLTSEFPNWLIACIAQIQNKYSKTDSRDIISDFTPMMFKLLCYNSDRLSNEFYDFARKKFVPEIAEANPSVADEFLDLL